MRQAFHILKKDVLYARVEICAVLALAGLYAWTSTEMKVYIVAELLLDIGAVYLIAKLIHAEKIPGDRQFWLTRPYRRSSLLAAKLLGILLLVNVPIFVARLYVLLYEGFATGAVLGPLLWSHFLLFVAVMLPMSAVASATSGLVPFTFSILALVAAALVTVVRIRPPWDLAVRLSLAGSQWMWETIAVVALIALALPVLYLQYRARRTWMSRIVIAVVGVCAIFSYLYLPWTTAAAIQTAITPRRLAAEALKVTFEPAARYFYTRGMLNRGDYQVDVPLKIDGVPRDVELIPDGISFRFEAADGTAWESGPYVYPALGKRMPGPGPAILNANVDLPPGFYSRAKGRSLKVTADVYVSLFGQPLSKTIAIQGAGVNAVDGLLCRTGPFRQLLCMAPFGWPSRIVYAQFPSGGKLPFTRFISYSPFPSGLAFDEVASRSVSYPEGERQVTIISNQPLGSFKLRFAAENFPLADFSIPIRRSSRKE